MDSILDTHDLSFANEPTRGAYDTVIVGSGPNGLAAAVTLAKAGQSVLVVEAAETIGGGMRSASLTLPGYTHDVCSAIHAMARVSPFFRELPLEDFGLTWIYPEVAAAHPLEEGRVAVCRRSISETADALGDDGEDYQRLFEPLTRCADQLFPQLLGPLRFPRHPLSLLRFGLLATRSAEGLVDCFIEGELAGPLFAGMAAHSILPLEKPLTAAVGLVLTLAAHEGGWPIARGGSGQVAEALARYLQSLGGEIIVGRRVESLEELPAAKAILLDVAPRNLSRIAGDALPKGFRKKLERFRYGPGVFKVDWALDGPIPWTAAACRQAGTVHVGGTFSEIAKAERAPSCGEHAERPFVLVAQQSLFDPTRAPEGKQTGWAYCHVPNGSTVDMTERIEKQIERFAPGFRDRILARHTLSSEGFEQLNPNYVGGDITGGVMDLRQIFTRPTARWVPYSTPNERIFLCSASTPPGGGVHGMCGFHAARAVLQSLK